MIWAQLPSSSCKTQPKKIRINEIFYRLNKTVTKTTRASAAERVL